MRKMSDEEKEFRFAVADLDPDHDDTWWDRFIKFLRRIARAIARPFRRKK